MTKRSFFSVFLIAAAMSGAVVLSSCSHDVPTYSEEEINHLMNLLRGDFYQLMITDKVKKDSDGDYLYDEGIVRMIKDKVDKDPSLKNIFDEKGIVVTKELVGNKIPQEIVPILEKSGIPFHPSPGCAVC